MNQDLIIKISSCIKKSEFSILESLLYQGSAFGRRNGTPKSWDGTILVDALEKLETPDFPEPSGPVEVAHLSY